MTRKIKTFGDLRVGDVYKSNVAVFQVIENNVLTGLVKVLVRGNLHTNPIIIYRDNSFGNRELLPLYSSPLYLAMSELDDSPESDKELTDET